MRWRLADFTGARIALIGYGREGRAAERALLERADPLELHVFAERPPEHEPRSATTVAELAVDPDRFDLVLRSPGVPPHHPGLARCRQAGLPMSTSSSIWFAERPDARVVAVTGSKGKSTTSSLLAHLAREAGFRTELAGNIGRPLLDLIDVEADVFVVELSSYQLVDLVGAPSVGAVTRLFPEHVDWHGSVEAYYGAKLRLADLLQGRPLWFNASDPILGDRLGGIDHARPANVASAASGSLHAAEDGLYVGERRVFARSDWTLPGRHNLDNLVLAVELAGSLGIDREQALVAARGFRGLAHRLESLGRIDGVEFVNDSISTTPHATLAALRADPRPAVLIVGGQQRGADWDALVDAGIRLKGLVALPETGGDAARALIEGGLVATDRVRRVEGLDAGVREAAALAEPGDRVLFSPGGPSFHRFRDFEARGEAFRVAVRSLALRRPAG
ncbi:UDP-N-acetylmuramoyl-L-alanine--D-glutamate ligase [Halomonas denitrificans]|nr:UDP-N-acetylmuramoyl-L-alanine--D-glutamate ligase [Halomonas denitrificans]